MSRHRMSRSERDMRASMLRLMKTVPYSAITVTMLAADAGINRKTFYAYYQNKDELLYAMLYDMFDDLFSCFMYEKEAPDGALDEELLRQDARKFLETVKKYEESILVLITNETSEVSIEIADRVVLHKCRDIHILSDAEGRVPQKFYLEVIRNFFMGMIDAWLETEGLSVEAGVNILARIMKKSFANMFRYVRAGTPVLKK